MVGTKAAHRARNCKSITRRSCSSAPEIYLITKKGNPDWRGIPVGVGAIKQ